MKRNPHHAVVAAAVALTCALLAAIVDCLAPTEITLVLQTNVPCDKWNNATVAVGSPADVETKSPVTSTTTCDSAGNLGTLVVIPSAGDDGQIAIKVVGGEQRDPNTCLPPKYGPGCIVARRQIAYLPHTPLRLIIQLESSCDGVQCSPPLTCSNGRCLSDVIDPKACVGSGCNASTLMPPEGGVSIDAAPTPDASTGVDASTSGPGCTVPIQPASTASPTKVVGSGTAASCTEQAFQAAVSLGGIITFDCGGKVTIPVTTATNLRTDLDTVIDGGGLVTLDGGNATRILSFVGPGSFMTTTTVTLQHLTFAHGKVVGTMLPAGPPPCATGYGGDGLGGAVNVSDGVLHVIDVTFTDNAAGSPGPYVGGGAISVTGSLDTTIVGSTFTGNTGSVGGAIASGFSKLTLVNDVFSNNSATGGMTTTGVDAGSTCSVDGGQVGVGGFGGVLWMVDSQNVTLNVCGSTFSHNRATSLGGALYRVPLSTTEATVISQSTFDDNSSTSSGGALYFHNANLTISSSTLSNNSAPGCGGMQADGTTLTLTNDTFVNNSAATGLGGALCLFNDGADRGSALNCTFANNSASAGEGIFGAAIAGETPMTIDNTVFDGNTTMDCNSPMTCDDGASTGGQDLQWPQDHVACASPDTACVPGITFADATLGPLAQNGGPTQTMLPTAGSPAIGIGKACPGVDQRGNVRKNPNACTAGAVEVDPAP